MGFSSATAVFHSVLAPLPDPTGQHDRPVVDDVHLPDAFVVGAEIDLGEPVAVERLVERPVGAQPRDLEEALRRGDRAVVSLAGHDDLAVRLDRKVVSIRVRDAGEPDDRQPVAREARVGLPVRTANDHDHPIVPVGSLGTTDGDEPPVPQEAARLEIAVPVAQNVLPPFAVAAEAHVERAAGGEGGEGRLTRADATGGGRVPVHRDAVEGVARSDVVDGLDAVAAEGRVEVAGSGERGRGGRNHRETDPGDDRCTERTTHRNPPWSGVSGSWRL